MATPSIPLASKSSRICCCSAAVPVGGMRKSTSTLPSSLAAASQPARAITQKSSALLETNASFSSLAGAGVPELDSAFSFLQLEKTDARQNARNNEQIFFMVGFG